MKLFLIVIFLIFNFQLPLKAEKKINELFGVKLNSDISLYANVEDGQIRESISTKDIVYTFSNQSLTNIKRDQSFVYYGIRTNEDFKVQVITAGKSFVFEDLEFSNNYCNNERYIQIGLISERYNLDYEKFKHFYRRNIDEKREINILWEDSNYIYEDESKAYRLMVYCAHRYNKGNLNSLLFISWMTEDYYRRNVMNRFKIMEPFDDGFIIQYLE